MRRTLNYTGRKRIPRHAALVMLEGPAEAPTLGLRLRLADFAFPPEAQLFLDARSDYIRRRFPWGTVSDPKPPSDRSLSLPDDGRTPVFTLLVIDTRQRIGRILGRSNALELISPDGKRHTPSILGVRAGELGQELWRLELGGDFPELVVNERIASAVRSMSRTDSLLFGTAYPAIVREVLGHVLWVRELTDWEDDDSPWAAWIRLAVHLSGEAPPYVGASPSQDLASDTIRFEQARWVQEVSRSFSQRYQLADALAVRLEEVEDDA